MKLMSFLIWCLFFHIFSSAEKYQGAEHDSTKSGLQFDFDLIPSIASLFSDGNLPFSSQCLEDLASSTAEFEKLFKAVDAWGKPEAGLTQGNVFWFGRASLCNGIEIDEGTRSVQFSDRIIALNIRLYQSDVPIRLSACMPDSCDANDTKNAVQFIFDKVANSTSNFATLVNITTVTFANPGRYDFGFFLAVSVFGFIALLAVLGTFLDYCIVEAAKADTAWIRLNDPNVTDIQTDEFELGHLDYSVSTTSRVLVKIRFINSVKDSTLAKLLLAFSLRENVSRLLSCDTKPSNIQCLNGIRVLSINWVVLGHTLVFTGAIFAPYPPVDNPVEFATEYANQWTFLVVSNGTFSVDSFFVLSGFLVVYLCIRRLPTAESASGRILFWLFYVVKRYLRLIPSLAFMTIFTIGIWKVMGNGIGAMWQPYEQAVSVCEKYWWINFLFVNNFVGDNEMCNGWTWYLANDFQFYILSIVPFVVYMKFSRSAAGSLAFVLITAGSIIVSSLASFIYSFSQHFGTPLPIGFPITPDMPHYHGGILSTFDQYYIRPYFRFAPYGLGMLLGFLAFKHPPRSIKMNPFLNVFGWILALGVLSSVIFGLAGMLNGKFPSFFAAAMYNGLSRPAWGVGLCYIIFACMHGHGGIINSFLSWKVWTPLSRLTYMVYLLHPLFIYYFAAASESKFHYTTVSYVGLYASVLTLTYLVSFVACLLIEVPVVHIENIIKERFAKDESTLK